MRGQRRRAGADGRSALDARGGAPAIRSAWEGGRATGRQRPVPGRPVSPHHLIGGMRAAVIRVAAIKRRDRPAPRRVPDALSSASGACPGLLALRLEAGCWGLTSAVGCALAVALVTRRGSTFSSPVRTKPRGT